MSHQGSRDVTRQTGPVAGVTQSPAGLPLFLNDARKYIHGADLFDALAAATAADGPVRLRLQRLSDRAVDLRLDPPDLASPSLCGFLEFTEGGRTRHAWLAERAELVTVRSPLMDREAVEGAEFGADNANVRRDPRFSVGKSSVILLVALLERLFPDDTWNLAEMEALSARAPGTPFRSG